MNRQQKEQVVDLLKDKFTASGASVVVQYKGLTVKEMRELRQKLREHGGALQVAKARLMRRAASDISGAQELVPFFKNQIGLVFSPTADVSPNVLKVLVDFSKNHGSLSVVAGCLQERLFDGGALIRIASLPPRTVLLAQALGMMRAPLNGLVGSLNQLTLRLLWVLKQVQDRK